MAASLCALLAPQVASAQTFANPNPIAIPAAGTAAPYPSTIDVTGLQGTLTDVNVTLNGLTHTTIGDIDVLLVSPAGRSVLIMSDNGDGFSAANVNLTFDDGGPQTLPCGAGAGPVATGTYRPLDCAAGPGGPDTFPAPAPAGPYASMLAPQLNGTNGNGTWSLYVVDDNPGAGGTFAGGWSLTLTSSTPLGTVPGSGQGSQQATQCQPVTAGPNGTAGMGDNNGTASAAGGSGGCAGSGADGATNNSGANGGSGSAGNGGGAGNAGAPSGGDGGRNSSANGGDANGGRGGNVSQDTDAGSKSDANGGKSASKTKKKKKKKKCKKK